MTVTAARYSFTFAAAVQVAVKCAAAPETSSQALNVLREIECFSSVKHPNVLPFLGACLSDSGRCLLVTEFMTGGSLRDWIHGAPGTRKPQRKLSERLRMALQVRFLCIGRVSMRLTTVHSANFFLVSLFPSISSGCEDTLCNFHLGCADLMLALFATQHSQNNEKLKNMNGVKSMSWKVK